MILGISEHTHSSCFAEIDEAVTALQKERGDDRIVAFNVHNFPHELKEGMICYNFDFPGVHFSEEWYKQLVDKYEVWDHCKLTADKFGTKYVPVGYHKSMERFERVAEPDIDVAFFGCPNERRANLLKKLSDAGLKVFASANSTREERDEVLSRCKLALNPLFYEYPGIFPVLRAAHCIANKVPVLSEKSKEDWDWCNSSSYEHMIEDTMFVLKVYKHLVHFTESAYVYFKGIPMVLP